MQGSKVKRKGRSLLLAACHSFTIWRLSMQNDCAHNWITSIGSSFWESTGSMGCFACGPRVCSPCQWIPVNTAHWSKNMFDIVDQHKEISRSKEYSWGCFWVLWNHPLQQQTHFQNYRAHLVCRVKVRTSLMPTPITVCECPSWWRLGQVHSLERSRY